jgi:hypothetical protein
MLRIYIPTFGRSEDQKTFHELPPKLHANTTLVVDSREKKLYAKYLEEGAGVLVCPPSVNTIGKVRQYVMERHAVEVHGPKIVMLDDDLGFCTRRTDDPGKFLASTQKDIAALFATLEKTLGKYAHAGVCAREGGNRFAESGPIVECTRLLRLLAYDVEVFRREKIRFDRIIIMEDFDVALQLLRKGYKNALLTGWCQGQGSSNAPGGCSTYRTMEKQREGALGLAKLHEPFVRVVEKTTKGAWNGQTRTDCTVYWKKAYDSSQRGAK